jgi:hypothetical protein
MIPVVGKTIRFGGNKRRLGASASTKITVQEEMRMTGGTTINVGEMKTVIIPPLS